MRVGARPPVACPTDAGFSLIELMVTITLLGLLTTLALPSFTVWIHNTQVRTVAESLQTGLRVAQTEALRRNTGVVYFRTNSTITAGNIGNGTTTFPSFAYAATGTNWVVLTTPTFGSANAEFVQGGSLGSGAAATTLGGPNALCFDANGRIATNAPSSLPSGVTCTAAGVPPVTFPVSQPAPADRPLNVVVSAGGRIRMCDPMRTLSATTPDGC